MDSPLPTASSACTVGVGILVGRDDFLKRLVSIQVLNEQYGTLIDTVITIASNKCPPTIIGSGDLQCTLLIAFGNHRTAKNMTNVRVGIRVQQVCCGNASVDGAAVLSITTRSAALASVKLVAGAAVPV